MQYLYFGGWYLTVHDQLVFWLSLGWFAALSDNCSFQLATCTVMHVYNYVWMWWVLQKKCDSAHTFK